MALAGRSTDQPPRVCRSRGMAGVGLARPLQRQRIQELEHAQRDRAHQLAEQVAQDTRDDAAARRVTWSNCCSAVADCLGFAMMAKAVQYGCSYVVTPKPSTAKDLPTLRGRRLIDANR